MTGLPSPSGPLRTPKRPMVLRPELRSTQPPRRAEGRTPTSPRLQTPPKDPSSKAARLAKAALLAGVAAASAFGVIKVKGVVEQSDALPLRTIVVKGVDADSARAAEVKAWTELSTADAGAGGKVGVPFFGIDLDAVAARVEQHPFIRAATVRRLPPDTLEITVTERAPRAAVRTAEGVYLLDDDGEVMKRARPGDALDVPVLSLLEVTKNATALELVRALERNGLLARASEVVEHEAVGFDVIFDDGASARVGSGDFDQKLARFVTTERELAAHGRHFSFMWLDDARHPERVAVRLRPPTETSAGGG